MALPFVTVPQAARCYTERGLTVVPVIFRDKAPSLGEGWQKVRPTLDTLDTYFNGEAQNIGILLGVDNLADVDLDSREALWAWREFQFETGFCFGRRSKPASHFFYFLDETIRSIRYRDPLAQEKGACLLELRCVTSSGAPGLQTVVPPSIHSSGEKIEFAAGILLMPEKAEAAALRLATNRTAGTALLGRHAPGEGARHDFFLALAGALAHAKWELAEALKVVRSIYRMLWGERADIAKAEREVESTFQRYDDGGEVTGLPHLAQMLDARVLKAVMPWFGLRATAAKPQPEAKIWIPPEPKPLNRLAREGAHMPDALVDKLIVAPSVSLVVGAPKAGKTLFAVQLAMSLAAGRPFLDYYDLVHAPNQGPRVIPVLVIEQDDQHGKASLTALYQRTRIGQDFEHAQHGEDFAFHCLTHEDDQQIEFSLNLQLIDYLRKQIALFGLRLIVLDSYSTLRGARPGSSDIVKADFADFALLGSLARETGVAIVVIHHNSKSSASLDWALHAAGTFAVGAATDTMIVLSRFPDLGEEDDARHVRVRGRKLADHEFVLKFRQETLDFDWVMQGSSCSYYPEIRELEAKFPFGDFNAKDVTGELGWARPTAYRLLNRLERSGILRKHASSWSWSPDTPFGARPAYTNETGNG